MRIQAQAPGKLILLGEYAVLEGADALVMSVNQFARVVIDEMPSAGRFVLSGNLLTMPLEFQLNAQGDIHPIGRIQRELLQLLSFALAAIESTCRRIAENQLITRSFKIHMDTHEFYKDANKVKLGLGSSAALTVAIIDGLVRFFGLESELTPSRYHLFRLAHGIHAKAQGKQGSGIDIAASAMGGVLKYNISASEASGNAGIVPYPDHLQQLMMLNVWSGKSASTGAYLSKLASYKSKNKAEYQKLMQKMTALAAEGCKVYLENEIPVFLEIIDAYGQAMADLGRAAGIPVFSDRHRVIADYVIKAGGVYKPCGAGGGDLGVAFFKAEADRSAASEVLEKNGFWCPELNPATI